MEIQKQLPIKLLNPSLIDIEKKIIDKILCGDIKIKSQSAHIAFDHESDRNKRSKQSNPDNANQSIRNGLSAKIGELHQDLQGLYHQISDNRKQQRQIEKQKRKQAIAVIKRAKSHKRSKSEYLKLNISSLKDSEEKLAKAINLHKQRQQKQLIDKQRNISSRIQANLSRKYERQKSLLQAQVDYWSKVEGFEKKKRHNSMNNILPKISTKNNNYPEEIRKKMGVNFGIIQNVPRKNSNILLRKRAESQLNNQADYQNVVKKFLDRAKVLQEKSRIKQTNLKIADINPQESQMAEQKEKNLLEIKISNISTNKHKKLGNQYLKEVIEQIQRSPIKPKIQDLQEKKIQFVVVSQKKSIFKNNHLSKLQQRWQKVLIDLMKNKISKKKANQELQQLEKHLNKINPEGIEQRTRDKLQCFEVSQFKKQENISRQKDHQSDDSQTIFISQI